MVHSRLCRSCRCSYTSGRLPEAYLLSQSLFSTKIGHQVKNFKKVQEEFTFTGPLKNKEIRHEFFNNLPPLWSAWVNHFERRQLGIHIFMFWCVWSGRGEGEKELNRLCRCCFMTWAYAQVIMCIHENSSTAWARLWMDTLQLSATLLW